MHSDAKNAVVKKQSTQGQFFLVNTIHPGKPLDEPDQKEMSREPAALVTQAIPGREGNLA